MNQVAIYPRDSITFKREPAHIVPATRRWTQPMPADLDGLEVTESNSEAIWAEWDELVEKQDK